MNTMALAKLTRGRWGLSYLEVVVALSVFGLTLAGLSETILTQIRHASELESRLFLVVPASVYLEVNDFDRLSGDASITATAVGQETDLTGSAYRWAARLGVSRLETRDIVNSTDATDPVFPIQIVPRHSYVLLETPETYDPVYDVQVAQPLQDDGVTLSAIVSRAPKPTSPEE